MEERFANIKDLKTYPKSSNKGKALNDKEIKRKKNNSGVPLSTQNAVKFLLEGTLRLRVCRYCLNVTSVLSELDEILVIAVNDSLHEVTIRDMVASFHPFKVTEDCNFPNKICRDCLSHTIGCYLFAQQCERAERALRNCFDDMHEKFEKLDPLEPVRKRGKRKLNLNHNILYTEHEDVINYAEPIINLINVDPMPVSNSKIGELECQKCSQLLPNTESLLNHEKSHPKSMWYNCRLCGKAFVKQIHLRRHLKENHSSNDEVAREYITEQFRCNDCGTVNEHVEDHLQHIEKHKFKYMFQNLIERRIDTMCSICLNKGTRMVDLGDVIHLHGGYPDLTGDKTIKTILRTSIPEKSSYKYRELLIPENATILRITKKYPNQKSPEDKETFESNNIAFEFSSPYLIDDITELDDSYIFVFAEPILNAESDKQTEQDLTSLYFVDDDDKAGTLNENDIQFAITVETPDINEEIHNNVDKIVDNTEAMIASCKICWILKKPTCKTCIESKKRNENNRSKIDNNNADECNFCWIFNKIGKCDYCKKTFQPTFVKENVSDKRSEINSKLIKTFEKINSNWQCNICLTNNKNRLTCICCDVINNADKNNFMFGKNYGTKQFIIKSIKETTKPTIIELNENVIVTEEYDTISTDKSECEDIMDIEMTINEVENENRTSDIESMDVTFEDENQINQTVPLHESYFTNSNIFQSHPKAFTFNIGTGNRNKYKRNIKPLRRMANAFHK